MNGGASAAATRSAEASLMRCGLWTILYAVAWTIAEVPIMMAARTTTMTDTIMMAAVESVCHAVMWSAYRLEVAATSVVVAMATNNMPCMTTTIACVECWTPKVEVVALRIAGVDAKVPIAVAPVQRTIKIGGCYESTPLCI